MRIVSLCLLIALTSLPPARASQPAAAQAAAPGTVTIAGDVQTPVTVSIDDLKKMPRATVTMS